MDDLRLAAAAGCDVFSRDRHEPGIREHFGPDHRGNQQRIVGAAVWFVLAPAHLWPCGAGTGGTGSQGGRLRRAAGRAAPRSPEGPDLQAVRSRGGGLGRLFRAVDRAGGECGARRRAGSGSPATVPHECAEPGRHHGGQGFGRHSAPRDGVQDVSNLAPRHSVNGEQAGIRRGPAERESGAGAHRPGAAGGPRSDCHPAPMRKGGSTWRILSARTFLRAWSAMRSPSRRSGCGTWGS